MSISRRVHQKIHRFHTTTWWAAARRLAIDQVDYSLTKGGKFVLVFDGNGTGLPLFAYFVEHRSNDSDQNIDRPAVGGDGSLNKPFGRTEVILSSCLK